ncbi:hypothetical protein, partial [Dialister succinatiphilus]|uniref:hypothetical protein n=1 Tax=Dialister succinatiphilus TaxID=487173 RepID=UPI003F7F3AAE
KNFIHRFVEAKGLFNQRFLNVQAKGGLWPTRAFYAECAQVGQEEKYVTLTSYLSPDRAIPPPSAAKPLSNLRTLGPEGPINLKNLLRPKGAAGNFYFHKK